MNEWLSGRLRIGRDENQVCRLEGHETEQKCVPRGESPRDGHSSKVVYEGAAEKWGI